MDRRHDLDWLRLIAILILLFYHTGMLFNHWDWHIKNPETSVSFSWWMVWLHYWRMPLLLFISGAGTYLALRKRTSWQYVGERSRRLLIPLAFGMFVIVPPQIYFEKINSYPSYAEFFPTVFSFEPYPEGNLSWHHLWFIAYLFVYSLIALPLFRLISNPKFERYTVRLTRPAGLLIIPSALLLLSQAALRPFFPDETHALIDDWAYFTFNFIFFMMGYICFSRKNIWEAIGNYWKKITRAGIFIMLPFYAFFSHFRQLIELPMTDTQVEIAFQLVGFVASWFWVLMVISWGQHLLNKTHRWLKHFNEGLYPFYILHQTVIIALGYYICQLEWSIFVKFWIVAALTLASCLAIYFALIRPFGIVRLFFGMKPRSGVDLKGAAETRKETVTAA